MKSRKILLLAGRYGLSGVPLAQLRFARVLAARGHSVKLVYGMVNEGAELPVIDDVEILVLARARVSSMILPLAKLIRSYAPDVIFSAGDHLNVITLLAASLSRSKAKISCSSRVTPYDTYSDRLFSKGWLLKQMMRLTMPRADALTCVSNDMVDQYKKVFPFSRHLCVYNIVDERFSSIGRPFPESDERLSDKRTYNIVAAGALESWKGFADLIEAMSVVIKSANARLTILGEGSQRRYLQQRIDELGMSDSVILRGNVDDPFPYFLQAQTFVLSSHVEGLPNVLVEAMICGCTPVATDCPTGPREVLQDGKYGYLVPMNDPAALAEGIINSFTAPMEAGFLADAVVAFKADRVIKRHAEILGVDWL